MSSSDTGFQLGVFDDLLELMVVHAEHDGAVHLDEAAIGVPGKAGIVGLGAEALDRHVVETEVEHGVHHAGHGDARAGAHRNQQRLALVAELQALRLLDMGQGFADLGCQVVRVVPVVLIERGADLGGEGEAGRDRQADAGHLRQVGALAAQQIAHVRAALVVAGTEAVHPLAHCIQPSIFEKSAIRSMVDRTV